MSSFNKTEVKEIVRNYLKKNMKSNWIILEIKLSSNWNMYDNFCIVDVHISSDKLIWGNYSIGTVYVYSDKRCNNRNLSGDWEMTEEEKAERKTILAMTAKYEV